MCGCVQEQEGPVTDTLMHGRHRGNSLALWEEIVAKTDSHGREGRGRGRPKVLEGAGGEGGGIRGGGENQICVGRVCSGRLEEGLRRHRGLTST